MTIMEKKNEKDLRAYVRPEAEILVFKFGRICQGTEDGSSDPDGPGEWD